jgi:hypothetical protein
LYLDGQAVCVRLVSALALDVDPGACGVYRGREPLAVPQFNRVGGVDYTYRDRVSELHGGSLLRRVRTRFISTLILVSAIFHPGSCLMAMAPGSL